MEDSVISYHALRRARSTLEDFTLSYFPYHELRIPKDFFRYMHVLVYVEGVIYQMDEHNERLSANQDDRQDVDLPGQAQLQQVLEAKGLLSPRVQEQLMLGQHYWALERRLCAALQRCLRLPEAAPDFTLEDALEAHRNKSFDYRVLNLLLYGLRRQEADTALLAFLLVDEQLVDIGDDLTDYEDDVINNSFNVYRAYIYLYGQEAQLKLAERISALEGEHARLLAALPQHLQQHYWRRHQEAGAAQGADKWVFPRPILDEHAFRKECQEHGGSSSSSSSDED